MHATTREHSSRRQVAVILALTALATLFYGTWKMFLPASIVMLAAGGIVGGTLALLVISRPFAGLTVVIFYIYANLSVLGLPLSQPLTLLVTGGVLLRMGRGERLALRDATFLLTLSLFAIIALQSFMVAFDVGAAVGQYTSFIKAVLVVFLLVQLCQTRQRLEWVLGAIVAGGIVSIVFGMYLMQTGQTDSIRVGIGLWRFAGTHEDPNNAALFMLCCIPPVIYFLKQYRAPLMRALAVLAIMVLLAGALATFSRQAIIVLAFIVLATLVREGRGPRVYALAFLTVSMVAMLAPVAYWDRVATLAEVTDLTADRSLFLRLMAAKEAWRLFLENPITGIGLNNLPARAGHFLYIPIVAHNIYLDLLCGVGIPGTAAFLLVQLSAIRQFVRAMQAKLTAENAWIRDMAYYMMIALIAALVGGLFLSIPFYYVIWVPIAIGLALGRIAAGGQQKPVTSETRVA